MKDRKQDLEQLMMQMTEEAISVKLDYEESGSNLDNSNIVALHHNSPLLQDENEKLSDIVYSVKRKKNDK